MLQTYQIKLNFVTSVSIHICHVSKHGTTVFCGRRKNVWKWTDA